MIDVLCVGEALVDFLPETIGKPVRQVDRWVRSLGGAPANVTVGVSRLGGKSALLAVTGDDEHGMFIGEGLAKEGVDTSHLRHTSEGKTGLAFVSIDADGQRSFAFYRDNAAEYLLARRDIDEAFIAQAKVVHFGTNSLIHEEARQTALTIAKGCRARGQIVSLDPNLRLRLWKDPSVLKGLIDALIGEASTVKLSNDETEFVLGEQDPAAAIRKLQSLGVAAPVVTLGEQGAMVLAGDELVTIPVPKVTVIDTTGAGDGFTAGWLFALSRSLSNHAELKAAFGTELTRAAKLGVEVGSRVTEALGAVKGLPYAHELPAALLA